MEHLGYRLGFTTESQEITCLVSQNLILVSLVDDYQVFGVLCFNQMERLSYHKTHISEMQCNFFAIFLCSGGNKIVF